MRPYNGTATPITVGWLLAAAAQGRIPAVRHVPARGRVVATLLVTLVVEPTRQTRCAPFLRVVYRRLPKGGRFLFKGAGIEVGERVAGGGVASVRFASLRFPPEWALVNLGPPALLRIAPYAGRLPRPMMCR